MDMNIDYIINYCNYNSNIIKIIINYFEIMLNNKKSQFKKFINIPTEWDLQFIIDNINIIKENLDKIIMKSHISKTDNDLLEIINYETYNLLKFILLTPKADFLLNKKINIIDVDEYDIKFYNNNKLEEERETYKYLFHGSNSTNWYSIFTNGLKNLSGTEFMTNGQAYGAGIYFSNDIGLSYSYCKDFCNYKTIGIFKINSSDYDKYKKTETIFVVPYPDKVELVSILVFNNLCSNKINIINTYYNKNIFDNELSNKIILNKISKKRILNEYTLLSKKYNICINNDNNTWELLINNITLVISFFDYPINPPYIYIKDKLLVENNNTLEHYISESGSINCNLMSQTHWCATMKIEDIINYINDNIIKNIKYIKLLNEYNNYKDSVIDYKILANKYFWRVYHL